MLAVTFDQFNVSLRNKYIVLIKKENFSDIKLFEQ